MAGLSLSRLLPDFPEIEVDKVDFVDHIARARADGVRKYPGMVCGDRKLTGFFLTRRRIRRFLQSL